MCNNFGRFHYWWIRLIYILFFYNQPKGLYTCITIHMYNKYKGDKMKIIDANGEMKTAQKTMDYLNNYFKKEIDIQLIGDMSGDEEITHIFLTKGKRGKDKAVAVTTAYKAYVGRRQGNLVEIRDNIIEIGEYNEL